MEYSKLQIIQEDDKVTIDVVEGDGREIQKKNSDPHISVMRKSSDPRILDGPDHKDVNDIGEDNDGTAFNEKFVYCHDGLSSERAAQLLTHYGRNELPENVIPKWYIFVSQLWQVTDSFQPMPLILTSISAHASDDLGGGDC